MGEFETVMQTREEVEGLHNRREFSQRLIMSSSLSATASRQTMQNIVMAAIELSLEKTELIPQFLDLSENYLPIGFN